jgi:hypothetical protein
MCATCHRVLTPLKLPTGQVTWHHGFNTDHEIVPVPVDDDSKVGVCDFCSEPEVAWIAECTPFATSVEVPGGVVDSQDDGAWAACEACGGYIRRGDWPRLLYRAEKQFNRATGLRTHGLVAHMHDNFRHHFTGVIERYGP